MCVLIQSISDGFFKKFGVSLSIVQILYLLELFLKTFNNFDDLCYSLFFSDLRRYCHQMPSWYLFRHFSFHMVSAMKTSIKLKKFLTRRPTYQAVKDKGYIKGVDGDLVMGSQEWTYCCPQLEEAKRSDKPLGNQTL